MRKSLVISIAIVGVVAISAVLFSHFFHQPKPLRPITVSWKEVGEVICFVDLDADGNDELLVVDRNRQYWWVQFRPHAFTRQKIPVPKNPFTSSLILRGQILALNYSGRILFTTRQGEKWVLKELRGFTIAIVDADHDGQFNDAVLWLEDKRKTVFSRSRDGVIVERPNLPTGGRTWTETEKTMQFMRFRMRCALGSPLGVNRPLNCLRALLSPLLTWMVTRLRKSLALSGDPLAASIVGDTKKEDGGRVQVRCLAGYGGRCITVTRCSTLTFHHAKTCCFGMKKACIW